MFFERKKLYFLFVWWCREKGLPLHVIRCFIMSYRKILLVILVVDLLAGLYIFIFNELTNGMTALNYILGSVFVSFVLAMPFVFVKKAKRIGYMLLVNTFLVPVIMYACSMIGYQRYHDRVYGDDVKYEFKYGKRKFQLTIHGEKYCKWIYEQVRKTDSTVTEDTYRDMFVIMEDLGFSGDATFLQGKHGKIGENGYELTLDSLTMSEVEALKANPKAVTFKDVVVKDRMIIRNDSLYGLFREAVKVK